MKNMFLESGFVNLNKYGEYLCGDYVATANTDNSSTIVLSDGLGSGVKANILATLTGKILSTMLSRNMPIEDSVYTIAQTLPVCRVRNMAYSTFTIFQVNKNAEAYLAQFDNPEAILLRDGKNCDYSSMRRIICDKEIHESHLKLQTGDMLILLSDGVTNSGLGKVLPNGWERSSIIESLESWYSPDMSSKAMASMLVEACRALYMDHPEDDVTVAVFKIRERQVVNLIIGPPESKQDDEKILKLFFSKDGKKIVCGGTTAQIVSKYLHTPVKVSSNYVDPLVPATGCIEGVDLVTEGVVTIGKVLEIARKYASTSCFSLNWKNKADGVSLLSQMLFEQATDINFFVGRAINPSHQNPDLPINFTIKMELIEELSKCLIMMGKKVKISYC